MALFNRFAQQHMAGKLSAIMRSGHDKRCHKFRKSCKHIGGGIFKRTGGYFCAMLHQTMYIHWKTPSRDLDEVESSVQEHV